MPITQTREVAAAKRLDNVRYAIRDLACVADEVIQQGHKVLPLNVGDPLNFDFQTPPHIIEAAYKAMRDGKNGYAPSPGIPEALEAIRGEAARKGITTVQDVFVTSGVSETVDLCISALVNPGEDILTPKPDYPLYSAVLCKLGIALNAYDLNEDDAWQPELADIERKLTPGTRGIVLINPNNPTGSLCSRPMLEQVAEIARRHNLVVFSDEIYDKLILDGTPHIAFAAVAPDVPCITFGGMSKNYLVPGWRIGWGIASGDAAAIKPYTEGIHHLAARAPPCPASPGLPSNRTTMGLLAVGLVRSGVRSRYTSHKSPLRYGVVHPALGSASATPANLRAEILMRFGRMRRYPSHPARLHHPPHALRLPTEQYPARVLAPSRAAAVRCLRVPPSAYFFLALVI